MTRRTQSLRISTIRTSLGLALIALASGCGSAGGDSASSGVLAATTGSQYQFLRCTAPEFGDYILLNANIIPFNDTKTVSIVNLPSIHHEPNLKLEAFVDQATFRGNTLVIPTKGVLVPVSGEDDEIGVKAVDALEIEGFDPASRAPQTGLTVRLTSPDSARKVVYLATNCAVTNKGLVLDRLSAAQTK